MKKPKLNKGDFMQLSISGGKIIIEIHRYKTREWEYLKIPDFLSGLILKYADEMRNNGALEKQCEIKRILGIKGQ